MHILDRIEHWVRARPERPAHVSGGQSLSYRALWDQSERLATHLVRLAPGDRSPVAVRGHKEPAMLVAFLAAVKAGRPYIPLDSAIPEERVRRIVASAGAGVTLSAADLPLAEPMGDAAARRDRWVGPDDTFYIIYTSGSTGEPKGVQITTGCLADFIAWMTAEQGFTEGGEVFLNQAPFSFDLSVMDLYLSLATGGTLWSLDRATMESPKALFAALPGSGVTTWVSTPSFALMCLAEPSFDSRMLPGLRRFLFCGETLPPDCAARLLDRFPGAAVWNTYGPTEATVATTSVRVDRAVLAQYSQLPVGYPKPGTRLLVVDETGAALPDGERGEIVIAGPNVSTGYLNNPEQTGRAFFRLADLRAYRTGDWGRFRDGMLFFEGRMDFQVKLHGYRIELGDIESHLRALPNIEDAVVLPVMRDGRAEWLAAFVVLVERPAGSDFAITQGLRQALSARIPAYMLPRKWHFLPSFPLTANGKADRRRLAEMLV